MMCESFTSKYDKENVRVRIVDDGIILLEIDHICSGAYTRLKKKEAEKLIEMLQKAIAEAKK